MTERFDLGTLLDLSIDRYAELIELPFGSHVLTVYDVDSLPQRYKNVLAVSQAKLQAYFKPILEAQEQNGFEASVMVAEKLLSSNADTLQANIEYLEALTQSEPGSIVAMIDEYLAARNIEPEKKQAIVPSFIARATQIVRTALDKREQEFQKKIESEVKKTINSPRDPLETLSVIELMEGTNSKRQKSIAGK